MSLNADDSHYYMNNKAFGIGLTGDYSIEGTTYSCVDKTDKCLGLLDIGRGLFNYQTAWIWSTIITTLPETGEIFTLNMALGFGNEQKSMEDKFTEDFMTIDGKHFKLDQTVIQDFSGDIKSVHIFSTLPIQHRVYPSRGCILRFTPYQEGNHPREGKHFSVLSFI